MEHVSSLPYSQAPGTYIYIYIYTRADQVVPHSLYQSLKMEKDAIFEEADPYSIPTWLIAR